MRKVRSSLRLLVGAAAIAAVFGGALIAPESASAAVPSVCATKTTASAQTKPLGVGVQFHGTWSSLTDDNRVCILNSIADSGANWVRIDIGWTTIQPDGRGVYHMAWGVPFVDKILNMAHDRGLKVMATFWQTPDWASGTTNKRVLPKNVADYAAAIKWSAARWKTQVQAWEIWNEPNTKDFLSPPDPVAYTKLLKAAYPAVKAGNPAAQVVFGGTMFVDTNWIGQAYTAGAKGYYDVMAVHPYLGYANKGPDAPDLGSRERLTHTKVLVELMKAKGESTKPIWFTEFGYSTHANTSSTPVWFLGVSEATQAAFLKQTLTFTQATYPQVKVAFWYNSVDLNTGANIHASNRGLLRLDYSRKPAFNAMKCYTRGLSC
jgi:hypothetical protein